MSQVVSDPAASNEDSQVFANYNTSGVENLWFCWVIQARVAHVQHDRES